MQNKPDIFKFIKENTLAAVAMGMALLLLAAYLLAFAPILGNIKNKYMECKKRENDIRNARDLIAYAKNIDKACGGRMLISEEEAATGIDNLTEHGKSLGINFTEIKPGNIIVKDSPPYKILPIELKIECSGEQFVNFIGRIDELKKAIVRVRSFYITPKPEDRNNLNVAMVIEIYLSAKAGALSEA